MKKLTTLLAGFFCTISLTCAQDDALPDGLYAEITTAKGKIVINLEYEKTPLTVCSFAGLAEGKLKSTSRPAGPYYDGLNFHRVIPNFMIQGGCPLGTGTGGPGYKFPNEIHPSLKHDGPGILSMANAGPGTNGSQFFITHNKTPHLNGKHTVFGKVVSGQDVVNAIVKSDRMDSVTIKRVGAAAKAFETDQAAFDRYLAKAKANDPAASAIKEGKDFLAANKLKDGVSETASGLQYAWIKEATGAKPKATDTVSVHYRGTLLNGKEFDSSYKRNQPAVFPLNRVIPGWTEGVQLMPVGSKIKLFIPSSLGYGPRGAGGAVPPNATLIFEVELLEIK